ncbi:cytochrome P450 [Leucogyrophana mollusca]|uniref:Cytochrome P450 n=1 Tax=Leucogyrophana mollusca TaxID=85980 RepID=A0ACB8B2H5_9AGAM|nr:cytochrome P450 [Leucogyrophana mollusca]
MTPSLSSSFHEAMSASIKAYIIGLLTAFVVAVRLLKRNRSRTSLPLPPGPTPLPLVGNVIGIKTDAPWVTYREWAATYGDLVYSRLLNLDIIIINSEKVAKELLEHRSHNYSDRAIVSINKLFGMSTLTANIGYGDTWRTHRRFLHQAFRPVAAATHRPTQLRKARDLMLNLVETPDQEDFPKHLKHLQSFATSTIMSIVYGYEPLPHNDPLVDIVEKASLDISVTVTPESAALLVSFPALQNIPAWFPGASFKRNAAIVRKHISDMIEFPFKYVQDEMARGTATPSMVSDALEGFEKADDIDELEAMKGAFATAFVAGAETTSSVLLVFMLAMVLHPEIQKRAQAEIDNVTGGDRLPDFEDRSSLPFVEAVFRETLRWHPVIPLGVAHAATESDVFEGYSIPKGATIIANAWAMSRDEARYPDAEEFRAERFLTADGALTDDTVSFAFGFGRRVCVGRYMADASVWSAMVHFLAIFDLTKPDGVGDFEPKWTTGLGTHPAPFPCRIAPRSPSSARLTEMVRSPV